MTQTKVQRHPSLCALSQLPGLEDTGTFWSGRHN